jgi:hypothetical protein
MTIEKAICECGREWSMTDYYYARCISCKKHIPIESVVQGWR